MIDKIAKIVLKLHFKIPKIMILLFLIISILMIPGITSLVDNVEPSLERVLPQDVEEVNQLNYLRGEYGSDMLYILVHTKDSVSSVKDPQYLDYISIISQKIETREHIVDVKSISDYVENNGHISDSKYSIDKTFNENPQHKQFVSDNYDFSIIQVQTTMGSSSELINEVINSIEEDIDNSQQYNPGTYSQITGFGAIDKATFSVIMSDFLIITFVSMALIGVIVFFAFKSFIRGMLPMIIVMNALVWTMGIVGYLNLTITVVSMVSAAMIMGLGIDFGIHQVHSYFRLREEEKKSSKQSLSEVITELLRAMIGASFTTIAGFLALLFGQLPAMKVLGIILSIGIFTTLIGAVFLLPSVIYLYDRNKQYR